MCSVSHDPYEVPEWFAEPAKELIERYKQTISYTDKYIEALYAEFSRLGLAEKTIFCVVGDHGEAFGEHGLHGHERIAFEENLRLPWVIRAPSLIEPGGRIVGPVSSIDLTPTILALLGFETDMVDFDGLNVINRAPAQRKVYFSSWMRQGPAGYVSGSSKYIYDPMSKMLFFYDLSTDPFELNRLEVAEQQKEKIVVEILEWRKNTFFHHDQEKSGKKRLFGCWICRWNNRISSAKYSPESAY
jgi:arylsulfatase A-like enzyme